ncbi:glycosyltransferase family 4 protein [uncultured Arthrobacter sp.]|uniref:glycosyltransferase family 4 protein n=1 Tax=uncultured Arthrobacter sp. TaxID=114050 RepID=UPI0026229DF6|nr:glycosyltransferase family 4 protein [uncultured Arthrobacter sp.]
MNESTPQVRALHVHDAASTARNLVDSANESGLSWSTTDIPWYYRKVWTGPLKHPALRARPVLWDGMLALRSMQTDVVHLHTGGLSPHMRWVRRPWILHLHGTDVRSRQYDGWGDKLRFGAQHASAILYSTPDLLPHVRNLNARTEPVYFPVPVQADRAPRWSPTRNRVVFASRWEEVKGGEAQIDVARRILDECPGAEVLGVDWGRDAEAARSAGVKLVPKMSYEEYKAWLATAAVVVGQMSSILSASELEALSIGVPLVSGASSDFYPDLVRLGGTSPELVAQSAIEILADPEIASRRQNGAAFIAQHHDVSVGVQTLLELYGRIIKDRR